MPEARAIHLRAAHDALARGNPLAALRAHSTLLLAPRRTADAGFLRALVDSGDRLARGLALRPLARLAGAEFDSTLQALAGDDDLFLREQAVWALADRPATPAGIDAVVGAIAAGGHAATLAQLTIERWATSDRAIVAAVAARLDRYPDDPARARLVETATVAAHPDIPPLLERLLRSPDEHELVRTAAARGLAARPAPALLECLWRTGVDGGAELRFACARALLALRSPRGREAVTSLAASAAGSNEPFDRLLAALAQGRSAEPSPRRPGIRVAQIFVQGRLDGELTSAGAGDGGGISTLLVQLGRALGSEPEIASVVTIARALAEPATNWRHTGSSEAQSPGVSIERVPFGPAGYLPAPAMWEHRLELERALDTALSDLGGVDVAHLRFADAGAFAAARVCARLGIPVAFTAAPDPHAVIEGAERRGELTRETFPTAELGEHYLLRAQLVADLLGQARAVVALPRPRARAVLRELIGVPFTQLDPAPSAHDPGRHLAGGDRPRQLRDGARQARRRPACDRHDPARPRGCAPAATPRSPAARLRRPSASGEGPPAPARSVGRR